MKKKKEQWKDIPELVGSFQISNHGRIRAVDRWIEYTTTSKNGVIGHVKKFVSGGIRCVSTCRAGYALSVVCINSKNRNLRPAKLVATLFLPERLPKQTQINHKDGNPLNNYFENLEWCTAQENMTHAKETGLLLARNNSRVLTKKAASAIKMLSKTGNYSQWELAGIFGVTQPHINNILRNRTWKDA